MEKRQQAALVFAGPVSRGNLTRLTGLRHELRFVKSSSVATASRAIHALRTGRAVRRLEDLEEADLLLVSVPDPLVKRTVDELAGSGLNWSGKTVVLFESSHESAALDKLRRGGAHVATMNYHSRPEQFVVEGDRVATRRVRSITGDMPLTLLACKRSYQRAITSATDGFYPVIASVVDDLLSAGMTRAAAERTAALVLADSTRTFLRSGRRLLKTPDALELE